MALGSTQPLTEMSTRNLLGADNLTVICEPIVGASTSSYGDSFAYISVSSEACINRAVCVLEVFVVATATSVVSWEFTDVSETILSVFSVSQEAIKTKAASISSTKVLFLFIIQPRNLLPTQKLQTYPAIYFLVFLCRSFLWYYVIAPILVVKSMGISVSRLV
jgi:hypothetical protein